MNWLGLGAAALLVVGLMWQSRGTRSTVEPQETVSPAFTNLDVSSPLPTAILSPTLATLNSPLPVPTPVLPPLPTPLATTVLTQVAGLQLTVLHTNDTWGYLLPCG